MNYNPDRWILLKIDYETESLYKILVGWYGGYLGSDSWKLNSGINRVEEHGNYYEIFGYSGSSYICSKNMYGTNNLTASILSKFKQQTTISITEYTFEEAEKALRTFLI